MICCSCICLGVSHCTATACSVACDIAGKRCPPACSSLFPACLSYIPWPAVLLPSLVCGRDGAGGRAGPAGGGPRQPCRCGQLLSAAQLHRAARMHVAAEPQQVPSGQQLGTTPTKGSASMPALVPRRCLAERALLPVVPDETEFPYTIRVEVRCFVNMDAPSFTLASVRDIQPALPAALCITAATAWASRSPCCSVLNTAPNCWHGFIVSRSRSRPSLSLMDHPPWHLFAAAASPCWMRVRARVHLPCTC